MAFLVAGVPIIYFLRDGVGLAPNNSFFTITVFLLPFLSSLVFKSLKYYEKPNLVAYGLTGLFLIFILTYFLLRDPYSSVNGKLEILTFLVIFIFYFSMVFIESKNLAENFIRIGLVISILSCLILAYSVYNDPYYILGSRVAIRFGSSEDSSSNPQITGKAGYFGVLFASLALKYMKRIQFGWVLPTIVFIASLIMLLLSQTFLAFLSFFFFCCIFFYFNLTFGGVSNLVKTSLRKWYVVLALIAMIFKLSYEYNKNKEVIKPFTNFFTIRFEKAIKTIFEDSSNRKLTSVKTDESVTSRILMFGIIVDAFDEDFTEGRLRYLIFGHGYKAHYADVPHLEVYDSFGIFGLILYSILYFYLLYCCFRYLRNPETLVGEFVSYAFIYFAILNFSGGVVVDYTRFLFYILVGKFVILKQKEVSI